MEMPLKLAHELPDAITHYRFNPCFDGNAAEMIIPLSAISGKFGFNPCFDGNAAEILFSENLL